MKTSRKTKGQDDSEEHKKPEKKIEKKTEKKTMKKSAEPGPEKKLPGAFFPVISAILLVVILTLVIILLVKNAATPDGGGILDDDKVKVEFYVMSQCPYGTQVENGFYPVLEQIGDAIDFHLDYIVQEPSPDQFQSLHGEKEVKGNIVQLCAKSYYPEDYKYMKFIVCQNKDTGNVATNWEACGRENGMDVEKLRKCLESDEGKNLLRESMQRTQAREATASPTVYINDASYQGARDSLSFQRAICNNIEHKACDNLPACVTDNDCTEEKGMVGICNNPGQQDAYCTYEEPVKVDYIVLTSADCKGSACDTTRIIQVNQQLFLGAKPRPVDINTEEGKQLVEKYGIQVVPAYIFDKSLEETKTWKDRTDLRTAFEQKEDKYKLKDEATGATFDPFAEICDNEIDDNGDGKIDCEDEDCKEEWVCMEKKDKPLIELFVMSYCPYGTQMEKGILPVVELLGDKIDLQVKFCDYAMHGEKELDEQLRQYCIQKEQNDKFLDYLRCFLEEGNSEGCLTEEGINTEKLDSCIALTDAEFKITKNFEDKSTWKGNFPAFNIHKQEVDKYGVRGSPSLVINEVTASTSRDPASLLKAVCYGFRDKPDACGEELSSQVPSPGFGFLNTGGPQGEC